MMPDKGVWVKEQYTGNFTGRVGTSGNLKQVNASGDQYYQIPITDGIVEVLLQKEDGSGNLLVVVVYQNGSMVPRSTKATPYGTIEIRETIMRGLSCRLLPHPHLWKVQEVPMILFLHHHR